jgi:hypothetical protein
MALPGTHFKAYISQTKNYKQLDFKGVSALIRLFAAFSLPKSWSKVGQSDFFRGGSVVNQKRWVYYKGALWGGRRVFGELKKLAKFGRRKGQNWYLEKRG